MSTRPKPNNIEHLLYDECKNAILQSRLCKEDTAIAEMYLLERIPQMDIAETLGITRNTVSHRLRKIVCAIEQTALKLYS